MPKVPRKYLIPQFVLAHFSHHVVMALPVPLQTYIRDDFALDYTQLGFLLSALALTSGICQLPGGWLADRIGRRLLITVGIVGVALAGLLIGLSQTYVMLLLFMVLMRSPQFFLPAPVVRELALG